MHQAPRSPVADRVRSLMAERGVSQETVGVALGITQEAVSRRVRGVVEWRATELLKLAPVLEISVGEILDVAAQEQAS